eukprot:TRINITY_DN1522_c0_g1_i1.p2 TRINITY_DN1522_c0_g1~~TRINITY_DN1522_c0_g1_i1.p2  ORF type:complete len:163 (-),score=27.14 TRINITY_DN1522_c0_g1_i1:65-553(-)
MTPLKAPTFIRLKKMIISPIIQGSPSGDSLEPLVEIYGREGFFPDKRGPKYGVILPMRKYQTDEIDQTVTIDIDKEVCGDILIRFFHQAQVIALRPIKFQLFRLYLHTSFQVGMGENILTEVVFKAGELDSKDNTDEAELNRGRRFPFPEGLTVKLLFEPID